MSIPVNFKSFEELCPSYVNGFQANALHNSVKNFAGCYLVKKKVDNKTYYKVGYKGNNSNRITHYSVKGISCLGFIFAEENEKREFDIDIHNKLKAFYGYENSFEKGVFFGNDEEGCHLPNYEENDEKFIKDVIQACSYYRNNTIPPITKKWFWGPRIGSQDNCIDKAINWWSKNICNDYFLIGMKCRGGKSYTTTKIIQELENKKLVKNKLHLITTYRPSDTYKEWYETNIFHNDFNFNFYIHPSLLKDCPYAKSLDELNENSTGIVFASSQCLSRNVEGEYSKYSDLLQKINWGVIATDEDDIGCNKEDAQQFRDNNIKAEKHIRITGTPYEEIINETDKFNEENTFIWDYVDEQKAKSFYKNLGTNNPYKDMAQIKLYELDLAKKIYDEDPKGFDNDGFSLNEFFRTDNESHTTFIHEIQVRKFLKKTFNCDECGEGEEQWAIFDCFPINHAIIKVPVNTINAFELLFNDLTQINPYKNNYKFIKITGDNPDAKTKRDIINQIEDADKNGKKSIVYTVYKGGRGISIGQWNAILHWAGTDESGISNYEQFNYRVQTPYKGKEIGYVFDYAPNRILEIGRIQANIHARTHNKSFEECHIEVINYMPAFKFCSNKWQEQSYEQIIKDLSEIRDDNKIEKEVIEKCPTGFREILKNKVIATNKLKLADTYFLNSLKYKGRKNKQNLNDDAISPEEIKKKQELFISKEIYKEQKNFFNVIKNSIIYVWLRNNGLPFDSFIYYKYINDIQVKEWINLTNKISDEFYNLLNEAYKNKEWVISFDNYLKFTYDKEKMDKLIRITNHDFKTPEDIIIKCWDKIEDKNNIKSFIQPCTKTGEFAKFGIEQGYIQKENCYFIARNSLCAALTSLNIFGTYDYTKYNKQIIIGKIEEIQNVENFLKEKFDMSKFDLAIMNPPYDGNLHLKILKKMITNTKDIINISPDNHFYSFDKFCDWNEDNIIIDTLKHLKSATFLTAKEFNKIFNCGWGITTVHIGHYNSNYYDWKQHIKFNLSLYPIYLKIRNKANRNSFRSHFINKNKIKNGFLIRRMVNDYQIIKNNVAKSIIDNDSPKIREGLDFESNEEKNIFLNSLNYWCYKLMINVFNDLNPAHLPYLSYIKEMSNDELCEYFNITGYIDDSHAEPGSEWETILKTMEEYK